MLIPKKYQTITIASILVIVSLIILSISIQRPGDTGIFKRLVLEAASPPIGAVNSVLDTVRDVWKRYIFLVGLEQENRTLKARIAQLTNELNESRELHLEGLRLRELLAMKNTLPGAVIAARVVDRENAYVFKTILINKGTSDGLRVGLPVVSAEGVVGRIVDASWNVSRVLLLTDYNSNISARIQNGRAEGILQGGGAINCALKYVERSEEVKVGDTVVTSGLGGVFPGGLILGTVSRVDRKGSGLFLNIDVSPSVHFSRLEEVLAVLPDSEKSP